MIILRQFFIPYLRHYSKMNSRSIGIEIKRIPVGSNKALRQSFLRELDNSFSVDRPSIVVDCSDLVHVDRSTVHFLLSCLEKAIMRNGDIKLAAISSQAMAALQLNGVDSLFEMFKTAAEAAGSYSRFSSPSTSLSKPIVITPEN